MARRIGMGIWFRLQCLLVFLSVGALIGSALAPRAARATPIAGAICYAGSKGQVSDASPIWVALYQSLAHGSDKQGPWFRGNGRSSFVPSHAQAHRPPMPQQGSDGAWHLRSARRARGDLRLREIRHHDQ